MNFLFWRRKRDSELEEEISSHLRMAERDRVDRGATPEKAQFETRRQFGNVGASPRHHPRHVGLGTP